MKKLKLKMQELSNPEVLTRQQLKNVLGGTGQQTTECKVSVTCQDGGTISCGSHGASGNPQGGESCQQTPSSVTCYDTGAPNNWNAHFCNTPV